MNERRVCRSCFRVAQDDDTICRYCCACSWLLCHDDFRVFAAVFPNPDSPLSVRYIARMLARVRSVK